MCFRDAEAAVQCGGEDLPSHGVPQKEGNQGFQGTSKKKHPVDGQKFEDPRFF